MTTDPFPELDPDRFAVDWIRRRVAEQLAADPNAPTILDAINTARRIADAERRDCDRRFWSVVARSYAPDPSAGRSS